VRSAIRLGGAHHLARMVSRLCTACGYLIPGNSVHCPNCGARLPKEVPPPTLGYHPLFRFQVDPAEPLNRDVRWVQIWAGGCLAFFGGFFLVTWGLVTAVSPETPTLEYVFLIPGSLMLGVGVLMVLIGVYRTLSV